MTKWSRYIFGASLVIGMMGILFADRLPEWWGPTSVLLMMVAAAMFLICSVLDYRRGHTAV